MPQPINPGLSEKLLTCPFCGTAAYSRYVEDGCPFGEVECGGCGAVVEDLTEAEAIERWNTRAPPVEPGDEQVEAGAKIIEPRLWGSPWSYPDGIEHDDELERRRNIARNKARSVFAILASQSGETPCR